MTTELLLVDLIRTLSMLLVITSVAAGEIRLQRSTLDLIRSNRVARATCWRRRVLRAFRRRNGPAS